MFEIVVTLILIGVAIVSGIFLILLAIGLVIIVWLKVPFAPTPQKRVAQIIDLLELKPGQKFYDLGCGDGRFVIEAAKRGAIATGYEISPWVYTRAQARVWLNKSQAKIVLKNFYPVTLTDADAVFCFLIDSVMQKVENKLMAELKPGAKVVCYGFKLPNWEPVKIIDTNPSKKTSSKIFLYIK